MSRWFAGSSTPRPQSLRVPTSNSGNPNGHFVSPHPLLLLALLCVAIWPFSTWASDWVASVDERSGLPDAGARRQPRRCFYIHLLGEQLGLDVFSTRFKVNTPYNYSLAGQNKTLDFDLAAKIQKEDEQKLTWDFALDAHSTKSGVMGGGIVFKFDPALFSGEMGEPVLLPDNSGWSWGNAQGRRIEMRFEPALASVYFEPGDKSEVRAFFYKNTIKPGRAKHQSHLERIWRCGTRPHHYRALRPGGPKELAE